jgi:hypothetical protein
MTPYYEGTSEAEHLIRGSPELVGRWLKKAKQDRSRLAIRLFQPQRKEFLDGFIKSLEVHLENLATREASAELPPEPPLDSSAAVGVVAPIMAENVLERAEPRAVVEPIAPQLQADSPPDQIVPEVEGETVATNEQAYTQAARNDLDVEGERALGIMRLSGWTVDADPQAVLSSEGDDPAENRGDEPPAQTGEPLPSVSWDRVFEQARGVSMVDLSAYDFIDGLGELRELIDHWQTLHQDSTTRDAP